jgi:large subunit ribosomal protein L18
MATGDSKDIIRRRIHKRIRRKLAGTGARPRLAVFRSLKHIYAQVIDDGAGTTLATASSNEKDGVNGGNLAGAKAIGKLVAERAKAKGMKRSSLTVAATCITAACKRWPTRHVKPG